MLLNYAEFILNIGHPPHHDYYPVMNKLGLSTVVDRKQVANLNVFSQLIDGYIESPVLLSLIHF